MGATQIVGGNLPMAAGLALASSLSESGRVVAAFVGDGGVNQGTFHETLNLAAIWKLPLLVIVENNGYAQTTAVEYATAGSIAGRAAAYAIPGQLVDGQDALAVHAGASEAAARARSGQGPTLIEARTYRYEGHFFGDQHRRYRTPEEVAQWRERDPLVLHRARLLAQGHAESQLDEIAAAADAAAEQALAAAAAAPQPDWDDLTGDVFAESDAVSGYLREALAREAYRA
jgi:pyruvate dehydrogenase E1 component alpha subunit